MSLWKGVRVRVHGSAQVIVSVWIRIRVRVRVKCRVGDMVTFRHRVRVSEW